MTWYWYVEHPNELLVDLDKSEPARLRVIQQRLEAAVRSRALRVRDAYLYPSEADGRYHLYVRLERRAHSMIRIAWSLRLGNDRNRCSRDILRAYDTGGAPPLLLEPGPLPGFYRNPDYICSCEGKHTLEMMKTCQIGRELRPGPSAEPFGELKVPEGSKWDKMGLVWTRDGG